MFLSKVIRFDTHSEGTAFSTLSFVHLWLFLVKLGPYIIRSTFWYVTWTQIQRYYFFGLEFCPSTHHQLFFWHLVRRYGHKSKRYYFHDFECCQSLVNYVKRESLIIHLAFCYMVRTENQSAILLCSYFWYLLHTVIGIAFCYVVLIHIQKGTTSFALSFAQIQ